MSPEVSGSAGTEHLYRRYFQFVLRRARRILRDEEDALDATQEIFARLCRTGAEPSAAVAVTTWLFRVTTNYCLNWKRNRERRRLLLAQLPPPEDIDHHLPADEHAMLLELLGRVPSELVEMAFYYYVDQLNHEEIAALVGVSRRTIGNRLEEFRATARRLLDDHASPADTKEAS